MRILLPLFGVIAAVALAASIGGAAVPIPSVHLAGRTLTGAHFLPKKPVTVTIASGSKSTFVTRPATDGIFRIALGFDPLAGCGGLVKINANGPRGESASLTIPKALCPGNSTVGVTGTASDGSRVAASG